MSEMWDGRKAKRLLLRLESIVKLDTNHQSSEVGFEAPIFFLIALEATCFVESISFTKASFHKDLIPEFSSVPIYKRDCSYLI